MKGKLLLIFVLSLLLTSQSFSATQIEMLTPDPLPSGTGDQFDVIFRVDMGGATCWGVQIWVTYNTNAIVPVAPYFTTLYSPDPTVTVNTGGSTCKYRATWIGAGVSLSSDSIAQLKFEVIDPTQEHGLTWVEHTAGNTDGTSYKNSNIAGTSWLQQYVIRYDTYVTPPDFPLPVLLSSYEGSAGDGFVNLQWVTECETDNNEFVIYRSSEVNSNERAIANIRSINGNSVTPQEYPYTDYRVENNRTYHYSLYCSDINGQEYFLQQVEAKPYDNAATDPFVPLDFNLGQNYPNPFNSSATIEFSLHEAGPTTLKLYNIIGEEVATLFDEPNAAIDYYQISVDGNNLPSGVYFYVLSAPDNLAVKKLVLMK